MALAGISCVQRTGCFELVTQVCGVPTDSRKQYIYPLYAIPIAIQNIWRIKRGISPGSSDRYRCFPVRRK